MGDSQTTAAVEAVSVQGALEGKAEVGSIYARSGCPQKSALSEWGYRNGVELLSNSACERRVGRTRSQ